MLSPLFYQKETLTSENDFDYVLSDRIQAHQGLEHICVHFNSPVDLLRLSAD